MALSGNTDRFLERTATVQWGVMACVYCVSHAPALLMLGPIPGYDGSGATLLLRLHVDFLLRLLLLTHPLYCALHLLSRFLKILEPLPCEGFSCIKRLLIVGERSAQEVNIAFHRLVC